MLDEESDAEREMAPDPPASKPSAELQRQFWVLVVVFNVALLATSLGVLLAVFEDMLPTGGALVFLGLGAFYYGLQRYRRAFDGEPRDS